MIPTIDTRHRLRLAREAAKLTTQQVADLLGVKRQTISNYENGHTTPAKATVMAWSTITTVPVWWLEGGLSPVGSGEVINWSSSQTLGITSLDSKRARIAREGAKVADQRAA